MAITENVRKALTDPTPFYAAAGTVDLAAEKLRGMQPVIERLREEAPERIHKIRATDPKIVSQRVSRQAKDARERLNEVFGGVELDLRKFRDTAQEFALQQVGRAAEYAVRAGETYSGLADRGRTAVRTWRGEASEAAVEVASQIEPSGEQRNGQSAQNGQGAQGPQGVQNGAEGAGARKGAPARKPTPGRKPGAGPDRSAE